MAVQFRRQAYIDLDDFFGDKPEGTTGWDLRDDIEELGVLSKTGDGYRPIHVELRAISGRLSRRAALMKYESDTDTFTVVDDAFDEEDEEEYGYTLAGVTYQGGELLGTLKEIIRSKVLAAYYHDKEEAEKNRRAKMNEKGVLVIGWDKPHKDTLKTDVQFDICCFRFRSYYKWEADVRYVVSDFASTQRTQRYNFTVSGVNSDGTLIIKDIVLNYPAEKYPVKEIYWKDSNMFAYENIMDAVRKELVQVISYTLKKVVCG